MFPHGELRPCKQQQAKAANSDDFTTSDEEYTANSKPVTSLDQSRQRSQLPTIATTAASKQPTVVALNKSKNGRKEIRSRSCSRQKAGAGASRCDYDSKDDSSSGDVSDDDDDDDGEDAASLEYMTDKNVEVKYALETILTYLDSGHYIR